MEIINPTCEQLCDLMCGKAEEDYMEWELKVELNVKVTGQDIDDILVTAFEGGITYWCDEVQVKGDYLGEYASDQVSRGGVVRLHDEDGWHELNLAKILDGIKKYLATDNSILEGKEIDTCQVDADIADSIVQYALFGEIVYG